MIEYERLRHIEKVDCVGLSSGAVVVVMSAIRIDGVRSYQIEWLTSGERGEMVRQRFADMSDDDINSLIASLYAVSAGAGDVS